MSLDLDAKIKTFLASAPQNKRQIQVIRISHSQMSKVYHLWREPYAGTVTTSDDGVVSVEAANIEIKLAGSDGTLDQKFNILLDTTDITDDFRDELDNIDIDTSEKVQVIYYEYLSDDLTDELARAVLQVETVSYTLGSATLNAVTPRLNVTRTGEIYTQRDVPMLRGFL